MFAILQAKPECAECHTFVDANDDCDCTRTRRDRQDCREAFARAGGRPQWARDLDVQADARERLARANAIMTACLSPKVR